MVAKARSKRKPQSIRLTCLIREEEGGFSSLCPELDVASQGQTVEDARDNLAEALSLFLEAASPAEVKRRLRGELFISSLEVRVG